RLVATKNFAGVNLGGFDLRGADLNGADLTGAILTNVNLGGADLRGAILNGSQVDGAILDGADLTGSFFDRFSGEFVLTRIAGLDGELVAPKVPDLGFAFRAGDYATNHPTLPGRLISFNTLLVDFKSGTTVGEANSVLQGVGARIVGGVKANTS